MKLELAIEKRSVRLLEKEDIEAIKFGKKGRPDRLILLGGRHHIWYEYKRPDGTLTPAQRRRIPKMLKRGERVFIITNALQGVAIAREERVKCACT